MGNLKLKQNSLKLINVRAQVQKKISQYTEEYGHYKDLLDLKTRERGRDKCAALCFGTLRDLL